MKTTNPIKSLIASISEFINIPKERYASLKEFLKEALTCTNPSTYEIGAKTIIASKNLIKIYGWFNDNEYLITSFKPEEVENANK